jgi:ribonuclease VapC
MIVDSSALIAILKRETEQAAFSVILQTEQSLSISAATYLETSVVVDSRRQPIISRELDDLIERAGIVIEPVTVEQVKIAREAYRAYGRGSGHPANLNFGDCFSYALAYVKREPMLYKGDDFVHTDIQSA